MRQQKMSKVFFLENMIFPGSLIDIVDASRIRFLYSSGYGACAKNIVKNTSKVVSKGYHLHFQVGCLLLSLVGVMGKRVLVTMIYSLVLGIFQI